MLIHQLLTTAIKCLIEIINYNIYTKHFFSVLTLLIGNYIKKYIITLKRFTKLSHFTSLYVHTAYFVPL